MAEPLSVAASVVGLVSLGIQVTQSLADYYISYRGQDAEIDSTRSKLDDLEIVFQGIRNAIEQRTFRADDQASIEQIERSIGKCEEVIIELQDELDKFNQSTTKGIVSKVRTTGQRVAYPFRKSCLQKLDENVREIRQSISLAQEVLQLNDSSHIRSDVEDIKEVLTLVKSSQVSSEIRNWLQAPDATTNHNEACAKRHQATGLWPVKGTTFETWLDERSSFLWINGFAGCGKSVLCSTAIQYVFRHRRSNPQIGVAFFYFSFNDISKQDASGMLRAILLQLSGQLNDGYADLSRLFTQCRNGSPPIPALMGTLQEIVLKFQDVYLLIDAVDEVPSGAAREHLLDVLRDLRAWMVRGLHILTTSRDILDIRDAVEPLGPNISMKNEGVDRDIADFIGGHLKESAALRRWSAHHHLIQEALTARAQGVFRWVECQFKSLAHCPRSEAILKKRLASLPQSLDETYERMLLHIDNDCIKDARRILTLLCYSEEPMTVSQVIEGVAVELEDDPQLDIERRFLDGSDILQICPGFLEIDLDSYVESTDRKLRISHFSVKEYLESERILQQKAAFFGMNSASAHAELTEICLVYLLDPALSEDYLMGAIFSQRRLVTYAAEYWHQHYKQTKERRLQIEGLMKRLFITQPSNFLNWIRIHNPDNLFGRSRLKTPSNEIPSPLYYASLLGLFSMVLNLVKFFGADINAKGGRYGNALQAASIKGHKEVVRLLLDSSAEINAQGRFYGNALQAASSRDHKEVVQLLLDWGVNVNAQGGNYSSSLEVASIFGHKDIVQVLLDWGADVNAQCEKCGSPLEVDPTFGNKDIVRLLLDWGADVNAQGGNFGNPLQAASMRGNKDIVRLLLDWGADVNAQGGLYGNPLGAASTFGYKDIVQLLLDWSADVNAQGGPYGNALRAASENEHWGIVQLLLDSGAERPL